MVRVPCHLLWYHDKLPIIPSVLGIKKIWILSFNYYSHTIVRWVLKSQNLNIQASTSELLDKVGIRFNSFQRICLLPYDLN